MFRSVISGGRTHAVCVRPLILLSLLIFVPPVVPAQEGIGPVPAPAPRSVEEPWEPGAASTRTAAQPSMTNPARLFSDAAVALIGVYQRSIGPNSIQRCPFSPSCSNFALTAIRRYGFFPGLCLFIDRNLYRENPGIAEQYGLVRLPSGVLKLDDHYFLTGDE